MGKISRFQKLEKRTNIVERLFDPLTLILSLDGLFKLKKNLYSLSFLRSQFGASKSAAGFGDALNIDEMTTDQVLIEDCIFDDQEGRLQNRDDIIKDIIEGKDEKFVKNSFVKVSKN